MQSKGITYLLKGDIYLIIGFVLLVLGILGGYLITHGWYLRHRELETPKGELDPPDIDFDKPFNLYWGGIKITKNVLELTDNIDINDFFHFNNGGISLKIDFDNRKILISTEIRNDKNETIVKIVDNRWVINTDPLIAYDRNYNDFAFEVIDSDQIPRLQVLLSENNVIYIGGFFDIPIGKALALPHELIINPSQQNVEELKELRIFKYPSNENFGKIDSIPDYKFD
jgi:hypothetical protein